MKIVTKEALNALIKKFKEYTVTAEQCEFARLAIVQMMIEETDVEEIIKTPKKARSLYRIIARVIYENCEEYEEQEYATN